MLRLGNVAAPLDAGEKEIAELVLHRLRIRRDELLSVKVKKKKRVTFLALLHYVRLLWGC